MTLSTYIHDSRVTERLKITSKTKPLRLQPKTKDDLKNIIEEVLEQQGPDADLNFIDTSEITDMSWLFSKFDPRNIKIDQWDVSKVKTMEKMFDGCKEFNSDLSTWNVSNVKNMDHMFFSCNVFTSDLSSWDVSNVSSHYGAFSDCPKMSPKKKPQFN